MNMGLRLKLPQSAPWTANGGAPAGSLLGASNQDQPGREGEQDYSLCLRRVPSVSDFQGPDDARPDSCGRRTTGSHVPSIT